MTRHPRTHVICPLCHTRYRGEEVGPCLTCAPTVLLDALVGILAAIEEEVRAWTCPLDGCLVMPDERCPACKVREIRPPVHCVCGRRIHKAAESACWECVRRTRPQKRPSRRRQQYTDTEHDPKRPVAWVRRGLIQYPVYRESGAA